MFKVLKLAMQLYKIKPLLENLIGMYGSIKNALKDDKITSDELKIILGELCKTLSELKVFVNGTPTKRS